MFKVECPGCRAPYQVDERRIPSTGLKMRCPKCGTSFQVDPPEDPRRTGPSPVLGGSGARPAAPARLVPKGTMIGVAPSGLQSAPAPGDGEADLPSPAAPPRPAIPRPAIPRPGAAPPPPPRRPAAQPAEPKAAPAPDPLLDLPSPAPPKVTPAGPPAGFALDDLDLPLPRQAASPPRASEPRELAPLGLDLVPPEAELPAPRAPDAGFDLDLPAVGTRPSPGQPSFDELELPSPRAPEPDASDDLPALPVVGGGDLGFGELDLPSPGSLPDLPSPSLTDDLPLPSRGSDLPLPSREQGLLPSAAATGLAASRLGGRSVFDLGAPETEDDFALEPPRSSAAAAHAATAPSDAAAGFGDRFGEISLPGEGSGPAPAGRFDRPLESDPFGPAPLPTPLPKAEPEPAGADRHLAATAPAVAEVTRAAGGGVSYGEVNLESGGEAEVPIEEAPARTSVSARTEEPMEFGGVPQQDEAPAPRMAAPAVASAPRPRRRIGVRVFAALFVVAVGGAALALVPEIGPFGAYWISDRLKADEYARLLASTVDESRRALGRDTASDAKKASVTAESAQQKAKRVVGLKAYAAFLGYARELRFGHDAPVRARAKVLLDELAELESAPYLALARAARAAVENELPRARSLLSALERQSGRDPDVLVLKGEVLLRAADAGAVAAWEAARKAEPSARTAYGLARAKYAAGDLAAAEEAARQTLEKNKDHVGARIMLARVLSADREKEAQALELLASVIDAPQHASDQEVVAAQTLRGDLHLARSRISLAEAAYGAALKIDPKAARALAGLGEATFRASRFSEALARFEAALQADPQSVDAAVGVAKSKLLLERADDALASLKKLGQAHPESHRVAYWYGRALETLGAREQALGVYNAALARPTRDPAVVDVYVALALLQNQLGRPEQAKSTLAAASAALPGLAAIPRALGEIALGEGRLDDAVLEFQKALAIDDEDLAARFKLGIAERRRGKFDEADKSFDQVAAVDKDYPGLALERGLLFEATGRADEALVAYEAALAKAPNDPDLMLRVGCGKVASGRAEQAEQLLRKVIALRSNSAETNHCLGRALLLQSRMADAQRLLERAVELDPNRAEYHLYMGWAATEAGNLVKAERALDQALRLDQALADAYWQRGVLRQRQGAVKDAVVDLRKALELKPSRQEVHAALAAALYDLGKEREALAEWALAVKAQPDNALWRFRYGRLLVQNQLGAQAVEHLAVALKLGEQETPAPRWLWEAHQSMARALGDQPEAAQHWEAFLRLGPRDSPYRGEAKQALGRLGRPWSGP